MTSKIANPFDSSDYKLNQNKKIQSLSNRKLNKLKITDSIVSSIQKVDVPNHLLNTSNKLIALIPLFNIKQIVIIS